MRLEKLKTNPQKYSSNVFFIRGEFNTLKDKNTLIDTGADDYIIKQIDKCNTGAGKKKVDKIILTHNHFDHTGGLRFLKEKYNPKVFAFSQGKYVDVILKDKQILNVGDTQMQIIYCPEHSNDSILLFDWKNRILFSGDNNLVINNTSNNYSKKFLEVFRFLLDSKIKTIYPGHGDKIENAGKKLLDSYENLKRSNFF